MIRAAPALGWSALGGAALVAASASLPIQLGFAVVAIGFVGMAHGASDLAVVELPRRPAFLLCYALVAAACLSWWIVDPALALPAFLIASAVHFGMEDAPGGSVAEKTVRGAVLVAAPAVLHHDALAGLLRLGGLSAWASATSGGMAAAGAIAAVGALALSIARHDRRLLVGTSALLLLPPLVGFSVSFLLLHALPQTVERRLRLGCASISAYLRVTWPILAAAILVVGAVASLMLHADPTGVRPLFAGIAALAMPHLLVTPWFEGVVHAGDQRAAGRRSTAGARRHVPRAGLPLSYKAPLA